jgi:hypothetical protein
MLGIRSSSSDCGLKEPPMFLQAKEKETFKKNPIIESFFRPYNA